jgi:cytochrome c peroxidase
MRQKAKNLYLPLVVVALIAAAAAFYLRLPAKKNAERISSRKTLTDQELLARLPAMRLAAPGALTPRDEALASLGAKLFFDPGFSANQMIACASCHKPELSFTDGLRNSVGVAQTSMNAPAILNVTEAQWFFWNGRADSLEAQALGPVENPKEHGFTRARVAHRISEVYSKDYEALFGALPAALPDATLPPPSSRPRKISAEVAGYALATLGSPAFQKMILRAAQSKGEQPVEILRSVSAGPEEPRNAFDHLSDQQIQSINKVFTDFGRAIAAFERTIHSGETAFDRFVDRAQATGTLEGSLNDEFGAAELRGLRLFTGKAQCQSCHSGNRFTDEQFHNIGLMPLSAETVNLGRSQGMLTALESPFNCLGPYFKDLPERESCRELRYLETESAESVAAFKTPTLRNLKTTGPYGHDGRFPNLRAILDHYNHLGVPPEAGHTEESLIPLGFNASEIEDLELFLSVLNGPVTFYKGKP